jgi:hypothetical protein
VINPERFTGYAGDSAHNVWRAIYEENCFGLSEAALSESSARGTSGRPKAGTLGSVLTGAVGMGQSGAGVGFSKLSEGWGTEMVKGSRDAELCEEKKVYYRVISGESVQRTNRYFP